MTDEQVQLTKKYCGAVAVSWYRSKYTEDAIKRFVDAGCRTNIHYVLSKNSIEEAVERLSGKGFPEGINAVIFLMHKPVGQGQRENMIAPDNSYLKEFCRLVNEHEQPFKIGFDSCSVPLIVNYCPSISKLTLDTCEGGRYSCYISSEMVMSPCSFDREEKYGVSLRDTTIRNIWNSEQFEKFRRSLRCSCPDCKDREFCMGGCPLVPDVALCIRETKNQIYGGSLQ
jgi:radical SAM protein with 4Fe4S-binding SPASM domain